jgi:tetratricopeptide (TPR) repeat protein
VARRGAREVGAQGEPDSGQRNTYSIDERKRRQNTPPPKGQDRWVRADGAHKEWEDTELATPKASRGKRATGAAASATADSGLAGSTGAALAALSGRHTLPGDVATDIRNAADVGTAAHKERLVERAEAAFGAFERHRYQDALRAIKPVAEEAPSVPEVRELAGLAAYRTGKWREAARHLQAFGQISDATEHLPILMDCQRALHKPKKVAELWADLRQRSPEPDVLAEGRIVAAASLADGGDLSGAIAMLSTAGASKALRNPSERHLRQWYLLGDLYERAGDVPRAREYFERLMKADPGAYDVADRLRGLGPERRSRAGGGRTSRPVSKKKITPEAPPKTKAKAPAAKASPAGAAKATAESA